MVNKMNILQSKVVVTVGNNYEEPNRNDVRSCDVSTASGDVLVFC